jgi:hypothetical protein
VEEATGLQIKALQELAEALEEGKELVEDPALSTRERKGSVLL